MQKAVYATVGFSLANIGDGVKPNCISRDLNPRGLDEKIDFPLASGSTLA